jgi:EAL domain-containing protein (putative c-di-GMP-specific phosphodiesterase class I)
VDLEEVIPDVGDPLVVMRRVVDGVLTLVPAADGAAIELAGGSELTYASASGPLAGLVGTRVDSDGSLSGLAMWTGRTLYCEDCVSDRRVDRAACEKIGAASLACVPLRRGFERVGVLKLTSGRARAFSDEDVAALAGLADFISSVIAASADVSRAAEALAHPPGGHHAGARDSIGAFVADLLRPGLAAELEARRQVERMLAGSSFRMLGQPIVELDNGGLLGVEALIRFPRSPAKSPDAWFHDAERVGLGVQLQLAAVMSALALLPELPDSAYLSINLGPDALASDRLPALLRTTTPGRIVVELTEHLKVDDYPQLRLVLAEIRSLGARLAIDDAGAGFASLVGFVNLAPDLIKLDRQFTRGIDVDPVRRALAQALVGFARDTGANVIAEGIETADELTTVRALGIRYGQGYLIDRPRPARAIRQRYPLPTSRLHLDRH